MIRKRGRPRGEVRRRKQMNVRVTDECSMQLSRLVETTGETKAEIIEKAVRMTYNLTNFGDDFGLL